MLFKIKKYLLLFWVISACYTFAWAESTIKTPLAYLTAMSEAHKKSTYELVYILQQEVIQNLSVYVMLLPIIKNMPNY